MFPTPVSIPMNPSNKSANKTKQDLNGFNAKRQKLVEQLTRENTIQSHTVKNAFLSVPREAFFPDSLHDHAYADNAFPIGGGQTISQPSTIAAMLELLDIQTGNKVLEIGSGSGYVLALLSHLTSDPTKVFGIELQSELQKQAIQNLRETGINGIRVNTGNGCLGWKESAPFDRILISAGCSKIPDTLVEQLLEGGIIVAPVAIANTNEKTKKNQNQLEITAATYPDALELVAYQKQNKKLIPKKRKCCYVFVPLICD